MLSLLLLVPIYPLTSFFPITHEQVLALPLPHRPLFPGFYMPIYVKVQEIIEYIENQVGLLFNTSMCWNILFRCWVNSVIAVNARCYRTMLIY